MWRAKSHRRPPIPDTAADIKERPTLTVNPRDTSINEADEERERPDLAAVGVSGQLERHAECGSLVKLARLVRQKDHRAGRVATRQRVRKLRGAIATEPSSHEIWHPGHVECGVADAQGAAIILKDVNANLAEKRHPWQRSREKFVVPGDGKGAEPCAQVAKRPDRVCEGVDRSVDEVAAEGNHIRSEGVGALDNVADVTGCGPWGDVQV
jgi:hypothetical protein